ncbi:hypothetical protein [Xylanimonas ulmi]|uniref:Uncharacterized protein n=1 Tax=Xylanimonas ulmi TaxID=228973 RepID=A0A4Q7M163_9MICO|nr:hypothetical protein [Xylanibacterium ulmi]RZS60663.1 hypothetical protein EV386_0935 [Xylanibacterium ulmi]
MTSADNPEVAAETEGQSHDETHFGQDDLTPAVSPKRRVPAWLTRETGIAAAAGVALGVVLTLAVPVLASGIGGGGGARLNAAAETCGSPYGISVEDGGRTLTFDMAGEEDLIGASFSDIQCLFDELELPERINDHMAQTTSMDGRQTANWDGFEVQWSYHPDRGLDGMIFFED